MSYPNRDMDCFSSSPASCPFSGQPSTISSLSSAPAPVFNQKLIPRDYLGTRSRRSPDIVPSIQSVDPSVQFPISPFQSQHGAQQRNSKTVEARSKSCAILSTGPSPLVNNPVAKNVLSTSTTTYLEFAEFPPISIKARSASYGSPYPVHVDPFANIIMPRTSSIDSAISSVSNTSLAKTATEVRDPSPTTIRNLIATAGGAEVLVGHLLKDKNNIASQNAQLWKLVEKQRSLLFGLNKDLERISKERDKYKKRAKELSAHTIHGDSEYRQQSGQERTAAAVPVTNVTQLEQSQPIPGLQFDNTNQLPKSSHVQINNFAANTTQYLDDRNKENIVAQQASQPINPEYQKQEPRSPGSVTMSKPTTPSITSPSFNIIEASPSTSKNGASNRKAPPKPLNLTQGKDDAYTNVQIPHNAENDKLGDDEGRGRRRTREEDDRDREISAKKAEAEARSRSKKNKTPTLSSGEENQAPAQKHIPAPLPTPGLPLSPRPQHAQALVGTAPHFVTNTSQPNSLGERLLAGPLKSPGLPQTPRAFLRNDNSTIGNSLPLSPRGNMAVFPLSPRAPKHALPVPTNLAAPTDAAALQNTQSRSHQSSQPVTTSSTTDRLHVHQPIGSEIPQVYQGLAASNYPNLLFPPNALMSIKVQVHASRMRPSRHGVLGLKNQEEATVFSLSVISRSSNSELWRIEKLPAALPQLEQSLRSTCSNLPRMPDRKLFAGQSPALLDERRAAIDMYFEELLDTQIDEQAAVSICRFLSTDVMDPDIQPKSNSTTAIDPNKHSASLSGPITKTGYLTKKGKNFGGWKTRFFIIDSSEFRYYESAGGPHLGTIRLQNALIGKQKDNDSADEVDGQYRHAFLIQEPKRKDATTYIRHVLCAESDAERDEWVRVLLHWVEGATSRHGSRSEGTPKTSQEFGSNDGQTQSSRAGQSSKDTRDTYANSPTPTSGSSIDSSIMDHVNAIKQTNISGPMNGGVITDNSTWGYRQPASNTTKEPKDKTHKMSNIFGFKKPDPQAAQPDPKTIKPRILRHNGYVRPVFGLPLSEAVEFCSPFNVEVDLPAVVYRSIEYLRYRNAANEEGLFRLSGSNVVVRNLKDRFNTEGDVDLVSEDEYHDVHAVASLFKTYLRELPSTLLTRDLHIEFIKVLELEKSADRVTAFNSLVHLLPAHNFALLKEMSKYLLEVTRNSDKNKMSVRNIGIVFSPTLNIPTPVFNLFLTEFDAIFEHNSSEATAIKTTEIKAPLSLTPEDIRSPRHQMFSDLPTPAYNQTTFHNPTMGLPTRGTMTGTGELGFMPMNAGYDSGTHVSAPRQAPPSQTKVVTQVPDMTGFSSLNGLLAPIDGSSDRARKRHSQIYVTSEI